MAKYNLLLPRMGESVSEATVVKWLKQVGDIVETDDLVLEIATDKVDSDVPSPVAGKLIEQRFEEDEIAQVGDIIAVLEVEDESLSNEDLIANQTSVSNFEDSSPLSHSPEREPASRDTEKVISLPANHATNEKTITQGRFFSPLVKSIAVEEGVSMEELENLQGSGLDGRVTKDDIMQYVRKKQINEEGMKEQKAKNTNDTNVSGQTQVPHTVVQNSENIESLSAGDEIIEMDRMRKIIADHMVKSISISAHATSFVEADVTNIVHWRDKNKDTFQQREGTKITFTPIFIEATAKAIRDFPMINVSVNGTQIIKKKDINIGMAAALPNGNLIVPVIKNADQLNLVGISKSVNDLAQRARANKLNPDEVKDGTFTITNIGSFGNIMGTPIINQPQVAILAVGTITKKPAVIETKHGDLIGIRHKMYLSLSYDHRVVDGALGGMFLRRVADYLEGWDINRVL